MSGSSSFFVRIVPLESHIIKAIWCSVVVSGVIFFGWMSMSGPVVGVLWGWDMRILGKGMCCCGTRSLYNGVGGGVILCLVTDLLC
jgi:hypothetical protein